ncbi:MAG: deoxyribonuclease IV [Bacilli bacterium]|nr:deoxyribonuclease IV [Bacilli bacterium]MDD4298088.1 deoxyribonuclease IV [Bacilli bacterium]MDD4644173.1 deoxyribonuclease IV [Bacilli bacterium]
MEVILGSHVSFTKNKQLFGSVEETLYYGGNTFMFYTGAPQNTKRERLNNNLTIRAYDLMKKHDIDIKNVVVHAPYIINLANRNNTSNYDFAVSFLRQEIKRCEELGISKIILHPGSHVGFGIDVGIKNIIDGLNDVINPNQLVFICLETMSGKGSECGSNFDELKRIIDGVKYNDKLLVCLDTCHLHDAGYDISDFDNVLKEFDEIIGLSKLGCLHINDSKNEQGSKKDRHANIGLGQIGFGNLINVIYHPLLIDVPKILETPYVEEEGKKDKVYPPYKWEIKMIKEKRFDQHLLDNIRGS